MKIINCKAISYAIILTLIISTTLISVSSEENNLSNNETVKIIILDTKENKISEKFIKTNIYNAIFEDYNPENSVLSSTEYITNKLNLLSESNIISQEKSNELRNNLNILSRKDNNIRNILPLNNDALNIFNGIFFKLKGEKLSSLLNLNVFNFSILNTDITALFSGYSEFQGTGFMFSIGFLGFQNIFKYSLTQPHFPEINGGIIGFVGILLISEGNQTENNELNILGIGMDILTYWNEIE